MSIFDEGIPPTKVQGNECLEYIDRAIGLGYIGNISSGTQPSDIWDQYHNDPITHHSPYSMRASGSGSGNYAAASFNIQVVLSRFLHDTTKRIVGYVMDEYDDGGLKVALLGNESINQSPDSSASGRNVKFYHQNLSCAGRQDYTSPLIGSKEKDGEYPLYPTVKTNVGQSSTDASTAWYGYSFQYSFSGQADIDMMSNWQDYIYDYIENYNIVSPNNRLTYNGTVINRGTITNNPSTTVIYGDGVKNVQMPFDNWCKYNPLIFLNGNLYSNACVVNGYLNGMFPASFEDSTELDNYYYVSGTPVSSFNSVAIPYNLILTKSLIQAQRYLTDGTLPNDAFLYPLDFSNLPGYDLEDDSDDSDNDPDPDGDPGLDGTPNPPEVPEWTINELTNNNYYWVDVSQLEDFVDWFWNDVGSYSDFDTIIDRVKGLYNDLASTILMIRHMPVDPAWIGGLGSNENIKLGMIEKNGGVPTLAKSSAPIVPIANMKVPKEYKSFASYSPYAQVALYLPLYGFIDLDIDLFVGRYIYVYGVYDHITGTLQYFIYLDNKYLVNSVIAKCAVDIPITLQSKTDRDSMIFSNVTNAIGNLLGAAGSMASGNPQGVVSGVTSAFGNGSCSAPLSVRGVVGEQGAFYAPRKCALVTSFPVEAKPDNFAHIVGHLSSRADYLNNDKLYGYVECVNPRITFSTSTPLSEEITEIYELLESGVIL